MKKLIIGILLFTVLSCGTTTETIETPPDSTKTTQEIPEEEQIGYIAAVALAGFIVATIIVLSNIIPHYSP